MEKLIDDMLAYSRVGAQGRKLKPTDINTVFDKAVANLQMAIDESGATITHTDLPTVKADESQMVQLFQNLISNGIKFCENTKPEIHIEARQENAELVFSITDNGIGMNPENKERIFEIFERLHNRGKYSGSGIGLASCKKIVERHGGHIWAESEPQKGSTFHFTLHSDDENNNATSR
jgi:light-regulated signal transduction histidine kinase (bacteriophytochrome)